MFKKILGVIFILIGLCLAYIGVLVISAGNFSWNTISAFVGAALFTLAGIQIFKGEKIMEVLDDLTLRL